MVFRLFLTNECQCNCFYCSQHVREGKGEFLPVDHAAEFVKKAVELGYDTIELTGGEPLLHPEFAEILKRIAAIKSCKNVALCTNGILLEKYLPQIKDAGIEVIKIHVDSVLGEQYQKITGRAEQLNYILGGLWKAVALGLKIEIIVKLHQYSEEQLGQILSLAKKYPVKIVVEALITSKKQYAEKDVLLKWKSVTGKLVQIQEHLYTGENWKGTFLLK